jgi:hypothetical protein
MGKAIHELRGIHVDQRVLELGTGHEGRDAVAIDVCTDE